MKCNSCQMNMRNIAKSNDNKLAIYYCESCDSAKCIDEEIQKKITIKRFKERLNHYEKIRVPVLELDITFDLFYIDYYLPRSRYQQDNFSELIIHFKNNDKDCIDIFSVAMTSIVLAQIVEGRLSKPNIIVPIPSSTANKISHGHVFLCEYLSKRLKIENGVGYLKRVNSVSPSHLSINRPTLWNHYKTIDCIGSVTNKHVLLFDDIYTTGNTACACIMKLVEHGAKQITLITLGKTKYQ